MLNQKDCPHNELMESFIDKNADTNKLEVKFYRCVDCGKSIDANKITTIPPSKSSRRIFAIQD